MLNLSLAPTGLCSRSRSFFYSFLQVHPATPFADQAPPPCSLPPPVSVTELFIFPCLLALTSSLLSLPSSAIAHTILPCSILEIDHLFVHLSVSLAHPALFVSCQFRATVVLTDGRYRGSLPKALYPSALHTTAHFIRSSRTNLGNSYGCSVHCFCACT
jgi:hypothetical protein